MSAKIYNAPKEIKKPEIDFSNFNREEYEKNEDKYIESLKTNIIDKGFKGKNSGVIIKFQVADGYAVYMVIQMIPLMLMHVPIGDEWHYENIDLMTTKRVQEIIDRDKAFSKIFQDKKK